MSLVMWKPVFQAVWPGKIQLAFSATDENLEIATKGAANSRLHRLIWAFGWHKQSFSGFGSYEASLKDWKSKDANLQPFILRAWSWTTAVDSYLILK